MTTCANFLADAELKKGHMSGWLYSMSIFTHQSTFFSQFLTFDLSFVKFDEILCNFLFALFHAFLDLILYHALRAVNGLEEFGRTENAHKLYPTAIICTSSRNLDLF